MKKFHRTINALLFMIIGLLAQVGVAGALTITLFSCATLPHPQKAVEPPQNPSKSEPAVIQPEVFPDVTETIQIASWAIEELEEEVRKELEEFERKF